MSNCSACDNLREYANDFLNNGVTEKICKNLRENKGVNSELSVLHKNCEDLHDINDCLIGALGDTLESYDICELKDYLAALMNNLQTMLKAMLCSDCGQWERIENLESEVAKVWVQINKLWEEINNIYKIINAMSGGGGYTRMKKGIDYEVQFYNGYYTDDNDIYVAYLDTLKDVYIMTDLAVGFVKNQNLYNCDLVHSGDARELPGSWVYRVKFIGDFAELNSKGYRMVNKSSVWNIESKSTWPGSWTMYQHIWKLDNNQGFVLAPTSFADGYNADFKHYGSDVHSNWLGIRGEMIINK